MGVKPSDGNRDERARLEALQLAQQLANQRLNPTLRTNASAEERAIWLKQNAVDTFTRGNSNDSLGTGDLGYRAGDSGLRGYYPVIINEPGSLSIGVNTGLMAPDGNGGFRPTTGYTISRLGPQRVGASASNPGYRHRPLGPVNQGGAPRNQPADRDRPSNTNGPSPRQPGPGAVNTTQLQPETNNTVPNTATGGPPNNQPTAADRAAKGTSTDPANSVATTGPTAVPTGSPSVELTFGKVIALGAVAGPGTTGVIVNMPDAGGGSQISQLPPKPEPTSVKPPRPQGTPT